MSKVKIVLVKTYENHIFSYNVLKLIMEIYDGNYGN